MVQNRLLSSNNMESGVAQRAVSVKSFFERLLSIPRGFKKFYPGSSGGAGPKARTSAGTAKAKKENPGRGKEGGKGGGKRDNKDPFDDSVAAFGPLILGTGLVGALLYLLDQSARG